MLTFNLSFLTISLLITFILTQELEAQPNFQISQSHYLDFPLERKDFENWQTIGSALIHQSKVILAPEVVDRKGIFYNTNPNPYQDSWMIDVELHLGNQRKTLRGGTGASILYLKNVDEVNSQDSLFGYSNRFDGMGVYLNTILRSEINKGEIANPITLFLNDGENLINPFSNSAQHKCMKMLRNTPEEQYIRVRIFYDKPLLSVLFYNMNSQKYELCTSVEADLSYQGYFLISAGSGMQTPDHVYLKSFKLYDPKKNAQNEHFQEVRGIKAGKEKIMEDLREHAKNLLKDMSEKDIMVTNHQNLTDLYDKLPNEHQQLQLNYQRLIEERDQQHEDFIDMFQSFPEKEHFNDQIHKIRQNQIMLMGISFDMDRNKKNLETAEKRANLNQNQKSNPKKPSANTIKKEVINQKVRQIEDQLFGIETKIKAAKALLDDLNAVTQQIQKQAKYGQEQVQDFASAGRQQQPVDVDMYEVELLFEAMEREASQGRSFVGTIIQFGMIGVIFFSIFVWCKLNEFEKKDDRY